MDIVAIEQRLQEALLPVFGLDSVEELPVDASLVNDIGADSLDFVEITYLIERDFGVVLKPGELVAAGTAIDTEDFFVESRLTEAGAAALRQQLPDDSGRFVAGMSKIELFRSITVRDLANIIRRRGAMAAS
ncbi:MAG TPA: phosphopantetheine-binding protein [Accumulibacter sp.]|nr:phosphopantetheine-binding protein [Accumulibacter sp.]